MRNLKLFYGSSYDRGLDILLDLWPKIIAKFPDATLDIAYGWDLFIAGYRDNPERMAWKGIMDRKMKQKGITEHGRLGKQELQKLRKECGIWVYPTYFAEINCITALETQNDGLVPVTMNSFAMKETVLSGVKVDGDIFDPEVQEKWLEALFRFMESRKVWIEESKQAREAVKNFSWDKVALKWQEYL